MKGAPQERRAKYLRRLASTSTPAFTIQTLAVAAEAIAAGALPASQKVNVLRAIARALGTEPATTRHAVETGRDVDLLALFYPNEYERLLRSYWALLGAARRRSA